jgi:hypothetical protein
MVHFNEGKCTIKYLKGTNNWGIIYGLKSNNTTGWVDANGNMTEDCHTVTSWVHTIDGGAISWGSYSQTLVTLSTTESEYVAATDTAKEGLWIHSFIAQIFKPTFTLIWNPTILNSDKQAAIAISKDHQFHGRTKHIDVQYHFIQYLIEDSKIILIYCPTEEMIADSLTKALPSAKAKHFAAGFGLGPV